jgi:uracil phosphoribosyltransferase
MAYELSKELHYNRSRSNTLRDKKHHEIADQLVICSILRAGFPMHTVFLNYFDAAQKFISASRHHPNNDDYFEILLNTAIADLTAQIFITGRSHVATGQSIVAVFNRLMERERQKEIH